MDQPPDQQFEQASYRVASENVFAKRVKDEIVLLSLTTGYYFTLNQVGSVIWSLIEDQKSVVEIVETLKRTYDTDDITVSTDVKNILDSLLAESLIVQSE